jgi:hypothetical protein
MIKGRRLPFLRLLRLTWRVKQEIALESEVSVENSKTTSPLRNESSSRTSYYLGGRYDF